MKGLRPFEDEPLAQVKARGDQSPHVDEHTRHEFSFSFSDAMGFARPEIIAMYFDGMLIS